MKKFLLLFLTALWSAGGQAGIFKPGERATELKSGTYFVYNTCMVSGTTDYTGFFYSSDGAMTVNHGPKPSSFSTNDPDLFWIVEVVDTETGKCTMRNAEGLYVDNGGNLTTSKSYVWITTYVYGQTGACGSDVYAESADETTSALPSTTASENAGLWIIGNEDKSANWTSSGGTSFVSYSAGQPMALYPAKTTEYTVNSVGELSAPEELEIGSYVVFYNNATQKYIWEGSWDGTVRNKISLEDLQNRNTQLLLNSTVCPTGTLTHDNTSIFKVGGEKGAYTFQNVITGDYIQPLNKSSACYAGSNAEKFSIKDGTSDDLVVIVGASNGLCLNQAGNVVGFTNLSGGNSMYKIATVEMTATDVDVVVVLYDCVCGTETNCVLQELVSPSSEYTYTAPSWSFYGYTTSAVAPSAETVTASKTVEYVYTQDESVELPFTTSALADGKFSSDTHWYKIQLREDGKYARYNSSSNTIPTSTANTSDEFACAFMVSGSTVAGFKFQNLAAGADKYLTVNSGNGSCSFTTSGTIFDYTKTSDGYNIFKARGTDACYIHDYESTLGTWRSTAAATVGGSNVVFKEITELTGTVSLEGDFDETDALVYDGTEYANGATMPWYGCYNTSAVTVKNGKIATLSTDGDASAIVATTPFVSTTITDGKFADDTKWYNLRIRDSKYSAYDIYDKYNTNKSSTANPKGLTNGMYCFVKADGVENGYKIYNHAAGAGVSYYNSSTNNSIGTFNTEGSTWILKANGTSGFVFQLNGSANAHINDVTNKLGVWNDSQSATDAGSTFLFEEVSASDLEAAEALPQAGKFYTIKEISTSQYLIPEMSETETTLLAMKTDASEEERIFYYTGTHLLGFSNGRFLANNSANKLTQADIGSVGTTFFFKKQSDGEFAVIFNDGGRSLYGARTGYVDAGSGIQTGTGYLFNVEEVTNLPLTIGTNGWSTFSAPVAVTVPSGVTAYYAPSAPADGKLVLEEVEGAVPANTGIIVRGTEGKEVNISTEVSGTEATVGENQLVANVVASTVTGSEDDGRYALATNTTVTPKVTGFMKLNTTITLPGHKCWLQTSTSASSGKFLPLALTDDPTGIETAETAVSDSDAPVYDLQGRKVASTRKGGMYIQNGKVFIAM